jgi:hypothetical protein
VARDQAAQVVGRPDGVAVDRDDHVGGRDLARRGRVLGDGDDERALRVGLDVVVELAQRDGRRDLLRPLHQAQVLPPPVAEVGARGHERVPGHDVGAVRPRQLGQLLEQRRLADDDVDVVDPPGVIRLLPLDLDLLGQRLRDVG